MQDTSDRENHPTDPQDNPRINQGMVSLNTTRETRFIEGTKTIEFVDWRNWCDCSDWPKITFFEWKGIEDPNIYYRCEFNLAFNYAIHNYTREAIAQGITVNEFSLIAVTVAHFIGRAARNYPSNYERKSQAEQGEPTSFRPVPFGEVFAVLGTNVHEQAYTTLLTSIETGTNNRARVAGQTQCLPESDFKAKSSFLILALAFLIEIGILHVEVKSYPEDTESVYLDSITPYDRRVYWFQELVQRYDVLLCDTHYTFTPQVGHSNFAYYTLVQHFRFATDHSGFLRRDSRIFNCQEFEELIESGSDLNTLPYWCPAVYRSAGLL